MMLTPSRVTSLAEHIARSWGEKYNSRFILIAPPLSEPVELFKLLADMTFRHKILKETSNRIKIARLREVDFTQAGFMRKLASSWGSTDGQKCPEDELYGLVQHTLNQLRQDNQVPVLLVERFHSGLKQLDRPFGVQLRDLENDFQINTVVELPTGIPSLRDHLASSAGGCPFLQSNWADGYEDKWLPGYSKDEIQTIAKDDFNKSEDFGESLYRSTAGLPGLIRCLGRDLGRFNDSAVLERYLRERSHQVCEPFFRWLDINRSSVYQNLLRRALLESCPNDRGVSLGDHPWAPILLDKKGNLNFRMLAWASVHRLIAQESPVLPKELFGQIKRDGPHSVLIQLEELSRCEHSPNELWKCAAMVCRFFDTANPTGEAWHEAKAILDDLAKLVANRHGEAINRAREILGQWTPIVSLMLELQRANEKWEFARIGEQVCKLNSDNHLKAYLRLLKYQIDRTGGELKCRRMDPHSARSAIGAVPESVLQIYCWRMLSANFWSYEPQDGIGSCTFLGHEHSPPHPGKRLDFRSMLLIHWQKRDQIPVQNRLLPNENDYRDISNLYGVDRSVPVHEFTPVSKAAWERYYSTCAVLIERLWKMLASDDETIDLPDLSVAIEPIERVLLTPQASQPKVATPL